MEAVLSIEFAHDSVDGVNFSVRDLHQHIPDAVRQIIVEAALPVGGFLGKSLSNIHQAAVQFIVDGLCLLLGQVLQPPLQFVHIRNTLEALGGPGPQALDAVKARDVLGVSAVLTLHGLYDVFQGNGIVGLLEGAPVPGGGKALLVVVDAAVRLDAGVEFPDPPLIPVAVQHVINSPARGGGVRGRLIDRLAALVLEICLYLADNAAQTECRFSHAGERSLQLVPISVPQLFQRDMADLVRVIRPQGFDDCPVLFYPVLAVPLVRFALDRGRRNVVPCVLQIGSLEAVVIHDLTQQPLLSAIAVQKVLHVIGDAIQVLLEHLVHFAGQFPQPPGNAALCRRVGGVLHLRKGRCPCVGRVDGVLAVCLGVDAPLVHDQRNVPEIGVGHVNPGNSDGGHGEAAQPKVAPQFLLRQIMQGNQVLGFLNRGLHGKAGLPGHVSSLQSQALQPRLVQRAALAGHRFHTVLPANGVRLRVCEDAFYPHSAGDDPRDRVRVRVRAVSVVAVGRQFGQTSIGVPELPIGRIAIGHGLLLVVHIHRILALRPHKVGGEQVLYAGLRVLSGKLLCLRNISQVPAGAERQAALGSVGAFSSCLHLGAASLGRRGGQPNIRIQPHTHRCPSTAGVCHHRGVKLSILGVEHLVGDAGFLGRVLFAQGVAGVYVGELHPLLLLRKRVRLHTRSLQRLAPQPRSLLQCREVHTKRIGGSLVLCGFPLEQRFDFCDEVPDGVQEFLGHGLVFPGELAELFRVLRQRLSEVRRDLVHSLLCGEVHAAVGIPPFVLLNQDCAGAVLFGQGVNSVVPVLSIFRRGQLLHPMGDLMLCHHSARVFCVLRNMDDAVGVPAVGSACAGGSRHLDFYANSPGQVVVVGDGCLGQGIGVVVHDEPGLFTVHGSRWDHRFFCGQGCRCVILPGNIGRILLRRAELRAVLAADLAHIHAGNARLVVGGEPGVEGVRAHAPVVGRPQRLGPALAQRRRRALYPADVISLDRHRPPLHRGALGRSGGGGSLLHVRFRAGLRGGRAAACKGLNSRFHSLAALRLAHVVRQ